jgi:hypothetical protein
MSLGDRGVFSATEEGDFSKNSGILQRGKMGLFCGMHHAILWNSFFEEQVWIFPAFDRTIVN